MSGGSWPHLRDPSASGYVSAGEGGCEILADLARVGPELEALAGGLAVDGHD